MRFASLGSGSRGNATLVECGATCIMVDCGFSLKETMARLRRLGKEAWDLTAIVLTHEHGDHAKGVGWLARRFNLPLWMTAGTFRMIKARVGPLPVTRLFDPHQTFAIDEILVTPFPVPHDALEPNQFVFSNGDLRLGILTDTGRSTPHIEATLSGCHGLILECNHDYSMLWGGPYPQSLKARIGGEQGHLDNAAAAKILDALDHTKLQHLVAAHLSDTNNTPALARTALSQVLGCTSRWIHVADQECGLPWHNLSRVF